MSIHPLLAEGEKAWWQFWKKPAPEPEAFTILGMEPVGFAIAAAIVAILGYTIYEHPRWFFQGLAESLGWMFGIIAVGVAVGGATALYTMSLGAGVGAFIVFMVVIAVIMFGANAW